MNSKAHNPRTARTPAEHEQKYVIADGAPLHYCDGYGLVGGGAIVSLAPGVTPGKWMVEISPEDAAKAAESEDNAQRLAVLAAAKIKAKGNADDVPRKKASDEAATEKAAAEAQAAAQREADAIAEAAKAQASEKAATDALAAEKQRADDLQSQLDAANSALAKAQAAQPAKDDKGDASKAGDKSGK